MRLSERWILAFLALAAPLAGCGGPSHGGPADMQFIPSGSFTMGSTDAQLETALAFCQIDATSAECDINYYADEAPAHPVELSSYYIDLHEVTRGEYETCVKAHACEQPGNGAYCTWPDKTLGDHPVNCVTWSQAKTFCEWQGRRLPSEAEWERAARGPDSTIFPWGNDHPSEVATLTGNFADTTGKRVNKMWGASVHSYDDGYDGTSPVGHFTEATTPEGLFDMAGNVWEWTEDGYEADYYAHSAPTNPTGPARGMGRVARGGGFSSPSAEVRGTIRFMAPPNGPYNNIGFRCAMDGTPKKPAKNPKE